MKRAFETTCHLILIAIVILIVFYPALSGEFLTLDDNAYVTQNKYVQSLSWDNAREIFSRPFVSAYVPLTMLSFMLDHALFGFNAAGFHATNILLHIVTSALVYWLAFVLGLNRGSALCAALVFAIHPMHAESVTWISERKDVLYAPLFIGAMGLYVRWQERGATWLYLAALILGFLSVLAKPMALSLPFILLLLDWYRQNRVRLFDVVTKIPFMVAIFPVAYLTFRVYEAQPFAWDGKSILIGVWSFAFYLKQFVLPVVLLPVYPLPQPVSFANAEYVVAFVILFAVARLLIRRQSRFVTFAVLFYLLSIFYFIRWFDVTMVNTLNLVADRYMYVASLGFCLLLGKIAQEGRANAKPLFSKAAAVFFVALFVAMGVKTWHQNFIWKDTFTLWNHVLTHNTSNPHIFNNRGVIHTSAGRYDEAMSDYNAALALYPHFTKALYNKGWAYYRQGQYDNAIYYFSRVLEEQLFLPALKYRADAYMQQGKYLLAVADYTRLIHEEPAAAAYNNRGLAYQSLHMYELSEKDFLTALRITPTDYAYFNLGETYYRRGDDEGAARFFLRALERNPSFGKACNKLGLIYFRGNRHKEALDYFSRAIEINPREAVLYYNRSRVYDVMQYWKAALVDALKAEELGYANVAEYIRGLEKRIDQ